MFITSKTMSTHLKLKIYKTSQNEIFIFNTKGIRVTFDPLFNCL